MPEYGNFEKHPISQKPPAVERKYKLNLAPWGRERVNVQLQKLLPMVWFHAQIW